MTLRLRKLSYESPPDIPDEQQRLEDLYALKILDTASEERFAKYTQLLTTIFQAPISLISFVDKDRLWFKSVCGLTISGIARKMSFCEYAMGAGPLFVVEDAHKDVRFAEHPAVISTPKIRFYAGAVIHGPNNQPIGTWIERRMVPTTGRSQLPPWCLQVRNIRRY
jgi:GAF domain-containing protein